MEALAAPDRGVGRMKRLNFIIVLMITSLASNHIFAGDSVNLFKPNEANLHEELGISQQDLTEILSLIKAKENYDVVYIEKQAHGYVGAWMVRKSERKSTHGPVFFYNKHDGKWYELEEMSAWEK